MTTTQTTTLNPLNAEFDAGVAGDARALAAALLRRNRRDPYRMRDELLSSAARYAAQMSARHLAARNLDDVARTYADAFELLTDRELRLLRRKQRDHSAAAVADIVALGGAR
ncbi:hypothetical protein [Isoptericola sp. QY 916]|uniref:hypothetical protein n=1 Tax=Isoptericola sp. QY 916 TaxID=2782570 RepID=UPI003D2FD855|nr:hypothetical protein [Isoptericola sp. QY 916]